MKNIYTNIEEAMTLVNQVSQFDDIGIKSIICMLIDTTSAKSGEPAGDIADTICALVHEVNSQMGAYQII